MKKVVGLCWAGWNRLGNFVLSMTQVTHWNNLVGKPAIWHLRERANRAKKLDKVVLWTEDIIDNQPVKSLADKWGLDICWISSLNSDDNIEIFQRFLEEIGADVIVDLSPHFPLTDPETIDLMVEYFISKDLDFLQREGFPEGMTPTCLYSRDIWKKLDNIEKSNFKKGELLKAWKWLSVILENPGLFKIDTISAPPTWRAPELNFSVVIPKGFALTKKVYKRFYAPGEIISAKEVLSLYREDPEWFKFLLGTQLEIEVTNNCNLKCIMCPRTEKMTRKIGYMDFDLFRKIIDETEALSIYFSGLGEPLLHSRIIDMFSYAKEKRLEIGLWTNGVNLNESLSREIIEKELLDYIIFSLDAATRETYLKIKGVDIFDKVKENILKFLEIKGNILKDKPKYYMSRKPLVGIQILKMKENDKEIEQFMEEWDYVGRIKKVINYQTRIQKGEAVETEVWKMLYEKFPPVEHAIIGHFNNYCSLIEDRSVVDVTPLKRFSCKQLQNGISILWDGKVVLCRQDFNDKYSLGNLKDQNLEEILEGERLKDIWQAHKDREYNKLSLCKDCKEWYYNLYA